MYASVARKPFNHEYFRVLKLLGATKHYQTKGRDHETNGEKGATCCGPRLDPSDESTDGGDVPNIPDSPRCHRAGR